MCYNQSMLEMVPLLASVVVISLSGVMMPGPMFAMTIAKSYRTPWAGAQVSLGHAFIEVPIILLIYFGFGSFFSINAVQVALSLLGGLMIIWMGVSMYRARAEVVQRGKDSPYNAFTAGIMLSGLNPFFLLWWATVGLLLVANFRNFGVIGLIVLIITHWLCDLIWLSAVSFSINRTQRFLGQTAQQVIFICISLMLVGFGGWFLYKGLGLL